MTTHQITKKTILPLKNFTRPLFQFQPLIFINSNFLSLSLSPLRSCRSLCLSFNPFFACQSWYRYTQYQKWSKSVIHNLLDTLYTGFESKLKKKKEAFSVFTQTQQPLPLSSLLISNTTSISSFFSFFLSHIYIYILYYGFIIILLLLINNSWSCFYISMSLIWFFELF